MEEFLALLDTILRTFEVGQNPQSFLVILGLAFARLLSFLSIIPFFGGAAVPARVKVATASAFVIVVFPTLAAAMPAEQRLPFGAVGFIALLIKEAFLGFALGFVASLIFESISMAGRVIDIQRGAGMAELFAPQLQVQVSELGQFKLQFAIVIFLLTGAHRAFLGGLLRSFEIIPPTGFPHFQPGLTPLVSFIITLGSQVLAIAAQLAVPPMIALLLTDLFFGLVNRVAPQINVFFLSLPVKMAVGIMVVLLILPLLTEQYIYYFKESYKVFEYLLRALAEAFK